MVQVNPLDPKFDQQCADAMQSGHKIELVSNDIQDVFKLWNPYNLSVQNSSSGTRMVATEEIPQGMLVLSELGICGYKHGARMSAGLLSVGDTSHRLQRPVPALPSNCSPFEGITSEQWDHAQSIVESKAYCIDKMTQEHIFMCFSNHINNTSLHNLGRTYCVEQKDTDDYQYRINVYSVCTISKGTEVSFNNLIN